MFQFGEEARLREVDHGSSPLAARHGAATYPLVFVNGRVLSGPGDISIRGAGRYVPWTDKEKRLTFQRDLEAMILREIEHTAAQTPELDLGEEPSPHEVSVSPLERLFLRRLPWSVPTGDRCLADIAILAKVGALEQRAARFPTDLQDQLEEAFAVIREKVAAERLFLALEHLQKLVVQIQTVEVRDLDGPEANAVAAVEDAAEDRKSDSQPVVWTNARLETPESDQAELPAAVQALAQVSRQSVIPLRNVSRLHRAHHRSTRTTLHYLGEALGHQEFDTFCQGLLWDSWSNPARPPSVESSVKETEALLVDHFQREPSLRESSPFRAVNTFLKNARTLEQHGLSQGAWLKFLEARVQLAVGLPAEQPAPTREQLEALWEATFEELGKTEEEEDVSMARLFLERAEELLANPRASAEDRRRVCCILEKVVPSCLARPR